MYQWQVVRSESRYTEEQVEMMKELLRQMDAAGKGASEAWWGKNLAAGEWMADQFKQRCK